MRCVRMKVDIKVLLSVLVLQEIRTNKDRALKVKSTHCFKLIIFLIIISYIFKRFLHTVALLSAFVGVKGMDGRAERIVGIYQLCLARL